MKRALIPAVLLVVGGILASIFARNFMDPSYLLDSSTLYMEIGLIALAMTLVIVCGQIDLSVGSNVVLTACLSAKLLEAGWGIPATAAAACLIGTLFGVFNGVLVAKLKLPSFLVTLGTMAIFRGAAQAMMGPGSIKLPKDFTGLDQRYVLGLPWPLLIFLVAACVYGFILHATVYGRWIFAVGTNESAARYSGLPIDRVKISVFALTGLMAGMGALLVDSRLGVARHSLAVGMELDVITVVVVGGTAITGGRGTILGSVLSLFLIMMIRTAMGVSNVKAEYQLTIIGTLLIAAVLAGRANFRLPARKTPPQGLDSAAQ